jgi:hypothetical protein
MLSLAFPNALSENQHPFSWTRTSAGGGQGTCLVTAMYTKWL